MEGKRIEKSWSTKGGKGRREEKGEESRFECPVSFRRAGCSLVLGGRFVSVIQFMKPWTQRARVRVHMCVGNSMNVHLLFCRYGANGQETACSEYFWNWIKTILDRGQHSGPAVSSWLRQMPQTTHYGYHIPDRCSDFL